MTIQPARCLFVVMPVLLLAASQALAAIHPPCQATDHAAKKQCQAVLSTLLPAVVFEGEDSQRTLAERMRHYRVPGVNMAVIDQGHVHWRAAYGQRKRDGAAVTPLTVFQAASISKPVAATLALVLAQAGELDLDSPVNPQLRSWQLPATDKFQPAAVTLRGLLSHSAGVNVHGFPGYTADAALPTARQILDGKAPANSPPIRLLSEPGTAYRYSGGGYQIVQLLIEDATGKPFTAVAQKRLLQPLGMQHSSYSAELPGRLADNVAAGHGRDGQAIVGGWHRYPELAAAGLWSTPGDLARYLVAVMNFGKGSVDTPITQHIAQLMRTPVVGDMGPGLGVHGEGRDRLIDQAGENAGYRTYLAAYPGRGQGVVIMTNGDGGKDLIREICRSLALAWGWPDFKTRRVTPASLDSAVLDQRSGDYRMREYGFVLTLERKGKALVATTARGSSYTFLPLSAWKFVAQEDGAELHFDPDKPDQIQLWGMHGQRQQSDKTR